MLGDVDQQFSAMLRIAEKPRGNLIYLVNQDSYHLVGELEEEELELELELEEGVII